MSDDFIPLNQSTPVRGRWQQGKNQQQRFQNNRQHGGQRRGGYHNYNNRWGNSPRSSFSSNSSNSSFGQDRNNIDAYLHPSMLQDPWASLREKNDLNQSNQSST